MNGPNVEIFLGSSITVGMPFMFWHGLSRGWLKRKLFEIQFKGYAYPGLKRDGLHWLKLWMGGSGNGQ
jgi:hypothetical protein